MRTDPLYSFVSGLFLFSPFLPAERHSVSIYPCPCGRASGLLPAFSYFQQNCYKHLCTNLRVAASFRSCRVNVEEWSGWIAFFLPHGVPRRTDCTCIAGHCYKHLCTSLAWNTVWQGLAETRSTHRHPMAMPSKGHRVTAGLAFGRDAWRPRWHFRAGLCRPLFGIQS